MSWIAARLTKIIIFIGLVIMLSACTLGNNPQQAIEITDVPTVTVPPSRTPIGIVTGKQIGRAHV